jgi:hypothetical protein
VGTTFFRAFGPECKSKRRIPNLSGYRASSTAIIKRIRARSDVNPRHDLSALKTSRRRRNNASGVSGELNVILDVVWRPVSSANSGGVSGAQIHPSCCAEVFVDQSAESVASVELGWRVRADGA